jgi:hypothetical protein
MKLKLVAVDVDTGNPFFLEIPDGLPEGTVVGQLTRWNGTEWVKTDYTTLSDANNSVSFKIVNGTKPDLKYTEFKLTDTSNYITLYLDESLPLGSPHASLGVSANAQTLYLIHKTNEFLALTSAEGYKRVQLSHPNGDISILDAYQTSSDTNKIIWLSRAVSGDYFTVYGNGKIFSKSLTPNTYLGANASKEIVSIPSPNLIKHLAFDIDNLPVDLPIAVGSGWQNLPGLNFMLEPSVNYELDFLIAIEGASSRQFKLRLNTTSATYTFRPFVINTAGGATDILYAENGTYGIPKNMDNEAELTLMTGNTYHYTNLKGILKTANNIANAQFQIYNDSAFPITVKAYSYLKLSR